MRTPTSVARSRLRARLVRGPGGCLLFIGSKAPGGYGQIRIDNRLFRAHRLAWELRRGPIPKGLFVCHTCDVPACCNMRHLFLGTQSDNMRDMLSKGRDGARVHPERLPRGDSHYARQRPELLVRGPRFWSAKLDEQRVTEIRMRYAAGEATQYELASQYGVNQPTVSEIIRRKIWRHVA